MKQHEGGHRGEKVERNREQRISSAGIQAGGSQEGSASIALTGSSLILEVNRCI